MSNHYTLSLVTHFKPNMAVGDREALDYLLMRSQSVPASWPQHAFFDDAPVPLHLGYESFARGEFLSELWPHDDGSLAGLNLRVPSLPDHAFSQHLLFADWLAQLSLPVGFVGVGTNEYRPLETMLLYMREGVLFIHEFQPTQLTRFVDGELVAVAG